MPCADLGLELTGVHRSFGGVAALRGIDWSVRGGEVHALLGQNGSGKSTLVKIITGIHAPQAGAEMWVWGEPVSMPITAAHEHGIAVIHQDLGLVESMTVAENMGVASGYGANLLAPMSLTSERGITRSLLAELGIDAHPDTLVADLTPAARASVAIARATRVLREHGERFVFILDEPTAYLSADESGKVIGLMRAVADSGSAVVFISHRLAEVEAVADRVTVLRDGLVVDTFERADVDRRRIIEAMLGQRLERAYPTPAPVLENAVALTVQGLSGPSVSDLSFTAAAGEIIGFAGLVGMGHEEVPGLLSGAVRATAGAIKLRERVLSTASIQQRIANGVALVPGNRQRDGLWLEALAAENLALTHDTRDSMWRRRHGRREVARAGTQLREFGVRPPEPAARAGNFSGGNQQKIVLAKWLSHSPSLLLLDEPTQGIDAGAKFEVLDTVCRAAAAGAIVVIASGDYEQLAHVAHRVFVMRFGRIAAELSGLGLTDAAIVAAAQSG